MAVDTGDVADLTCGVFEAIEFIAGEVFSTTPDTLYRPDR